MKNVLIVGGGLVGSLLASSMSRKGYKVRLYERRRDIRTVEIVAGKSINLALSTRGWKAIDMAGVRSQVEKIAIPMYGRILHDMEENTAFHSYGKDDQAIYSVSRGDLNACLLEQAETEHGVELFFNWKCEGVDFDKSEAHFTNTETGEEIVEKADLILGTDGAFSQVRASMQRTRRFDYQQEYIAHGYRELLLPADPGGNYRMDKGALHIWPRGNYMLIALPNLDGSFTCTLFMPYEGPESFEAIERGDGVLAFFKKVFPDFYKMMPELETNYSEHPLSDLLIIRCYPWVRNKTLILGDASHAIVPFYGQGMNSGFEDCSVLDELIDKHDHNWDEILDAFQKKRKPEADAIAELALRNYIEMRDLAADPVFILRKKIETKIYSKYPKEWMPLYSQVTFSHIPYNDALAAGLRQDAIMEEIMTRADITENWDSDEVENAILRKIRS